LYELEHVSGTRQHHAAIVELSLAPGSFRVAGRAGGARTGIRYSARLVFVGRIASSSGLFQSRAAAARTTQKAALRRRGRFHSRKRDCVMNTEIRLRRA